VLLCARAGVPAGFHGLRRGSGERERRRECGECERASGRRREGLGVQFISGDEGRERIAEERSVLTPSMACLQGRISGKSNGNSESPLTRCRNGQREVGLWSLGTGTAFARLRSGQGRLAGAGRGPGVRRPGLQGLQAGARHRAQGRVQGARAARGVAALGAARCGCSAGREKGKEREPVGRERGWRGRSRGRRRHGRRRRLEEGGGARGGGWEARGAAA
jgi:hypothetical protein